MSKAITFSLVFIILSFVLISTPSKIFAQETELFFSEYIEGSSNNKALEIFNPTYSEVNLSNYSIEFYYNGSSSPHSSKPSLSGSLGNNQTYVICNSASDQQIINKCNLQHGSVDFNGDDTIVLKKGEQIIDVIGQIGFDPGTEWGSGLTSTADNTLRRKCEINQGDTNPNDAFDPSIEWDGFTNNTFDGLGSHAPCTPPPSEAVCGNNEVQEGEVCDGNSQSCTTSDGYGGRETCNTSCNGWESCLSQEFCGDSILNGPEQCDDGNNEDGDGCSSSCQNEEVIKTSTIFGFVFFDRNKNGLWDGLWKGEFKLKNWKVFIDMNNNRAYDKGERLDRGVFVFDNLAPGEYSVCEKVKWGWQSTLPNHTNCQLVIVGSGEEKEVRFGNHLVPLFSKDTKTSL